MSNVREQPDWWLGADGQWHPPPVPGPNEPSALLGGGHPTSARAAPASSPSDREAGSTSAGRPSALARCPKGHPVAPTALFCGSCGSALGGPTAPQPTVALPVRGRPSVVPRDPSPLRGSTAGTWAAAWTNPVGFLICLGGLVVGLSPFQTWFTSGNSQPVTLSDLAVGRFASAAIVAKVALFVAAGVAIVIPLIPMRPGVASVITGLVAAVALALAASETVNAVLAWTYANGDDFQSPAVGIYLAAIGLLMVMAGSVAYNFSTLRLNQRTASGQR